jgi:hypothetical protein
MTIKLVAIAVATLAISAGAAVAQTGGYVYPDPLPRWMPSANAPGSSGTAAQRGVGTVGSAPGSTAIYESHTAAPNGTWLFQPNDVGGGPN